MRFRPVREREQESFQWFRSDLPDGVLVPAPPPRRRRLAAAARMLPVPAPVRRLGRALVYETMVMLLAAAAFAAFHHTSALMVAPPAPPGALCGTPTLNGPSSPPPGAVTVPAGDNSGMWPGFQAQNTTYWFAPGVHTLGSGQFDQIIPTSGNTFIGAPGAIIDGQGLNDFMTTGFAKNVTIEYLTIENFRPPGGQGAVDHDAADDWTIEYNTIQDNLPGSGVYVGSFTTVDYNCITANGEQGFGVTGCTTCSQTTGGPQDVTMDGNEISFNDTCNWEDVPLGNFPITPPAACSGAGQFVGCGCSGGGKFFLTDTTTFDDNYVHGNYSVGVWWDTDNTGAQAENNYIADNYAEGLIYEISYNGLIEDNVFIHNLTELGVYGLSPAGFSFGAVYISESGSDPRVPGRYGTQLLIAGNQFWNNFGGVALWENPDRFCAGLTGDQFCTLVNEGSPLGQGAAPQQPGRQNSRRGLPPPGRTYGGTQNNVIRWGFENLVPCTNPAVISIQPYLSDCRWKTQNVLVTGNFFDFTPAAVGPFCTAVNFCGYNGLFSNNGDNPYYPGSTVPAALTFGQNNLFAGNTYCGPWNFTAEFLNGQTTYNGWTGAPYNQDPGSTLGGPACQTVQPPPAGPPRTPVKAPAQVPVFPGRR